MKTIVIIGGTRTAALNRLKKIAPDNGVIHRDWYDEVELDGHRIMSFSGGPDDVDNICWLRALGAGNIAEIITVEDAGISEEMWGRIRHVRSTNKM